MISFICLLDYLTASKQYKNQKAIKLVLLSDKHTRKASLAICHCYCRNKSKVINKEKGKMYWAQTDSPEK